MAPPPGTGLQPDALQPGVQVFALRLRFSDRGNTEQDTAYRGLANARVEVLDGPNAGTVAFANACGIATLVGTFNSTTRFRASLEGFAQETRTWVCSASACGDGLATPWLPFHLDVADAPVDLAGDYTVTFVADSACADLPVDVRTRTYAATIAPAPPPGYRPEIVNNTLMNVTLTGASFLGGLNGFGIGVARDYAYFWLHGGHNPAVVEQLGANSYVAFSGTASATVTTGASTIAMPFEGWIDYCVTRDPATGRVYICGADGFGRPSNHRLSGHFWQCAGRLGPVRRLLNTARPAPRRNRREVVSPWIATRPDRMPPWSLSPATPCVSSAWASTRTRNRLSICGPTATSVDPKGSPRTRAS